MDKELVVQEWQYVFLQIAHLVSNFFLALLHQKVIDYKIFKSSSFTDTLLSYYQILHKPICVSNIRWSIINMLDYYIIQSKFLIFMFDLNFKLIFFYEKMPETSKKTTDQIRGKFSKDFVPLVQSFSSPRS